jgi:hypothetical protein
MSKNDLADKTLQESQCVSEVCSFYIELLSNARMDCFSDEGFLYYRSEWLSDINPSLH